MEIKNKILIVDDEELGRDTLESLLVKEPYHLLFAKDGFETLEIAKKEQPDLILLDVMMPGMDGFETCAKLREDPIISETPVIMVTALEDKDSRIRGIEAGADDFISKPFDRLELRTRIKTITKLNRYRKLLNERHKFEWVINQACDGFVIIEKDCTIVFVNKTAEEILGISSENKKFNFIELVKSNFNLEPGFSWANWPDSPKEILGEILPRFLVSPETDTSNEIWIKVDSINIPDDPKNQILVNLVDVTKEISDKHDLFTFHSMISHKLRTPFNGILGGIDYLSDEVDHLLNEDQKEFFQLTKDSAHRYYNSLESILEYIRFSDIIKYRDGIEMNKLPGLINEMGQELKIDSVKFENHDDFGETKLIFNGDLMELIVLKLLDNSQKFHPDHKPGIDVSLSLSKAGKAILKIADNGINLTAEQLSKMWSPYYQVDKSWTGEVAGMGLGLAYVATTLWHVGGKCKSYNVENGPGIIVELEIPLAS